MELSSMHTINIGTLNQRRERYVYFLTILFFAILLLTSYGMHNLGFYVENKDQIQEVKEVCLSRYPNTLTRELWMLRAYGNGNDIVRHTTNMIFSDGDKDPWRVGGVPPNASSPDGSVFHIMIRDSAHHQDLRFQDNVYDSKELLAARRMEQDCIGKWLQQ